MHLLAIPSILDGGESRLIKPQSQAESASDRPEKSPQMSVRPTPARPPRFNAVETGGKHLPVALRQIGTTGKLSLNPSDKSVA
jgi:hypothetical protein